MHYDQNEFDVRCEWGEPGVRLLAPHANAVVIVDIFSFSTCVDIAAGNGALVYPYHSQDESAVAYAQSLDAVLASRRLEDSGFRLLPTSLLGITAGTRLVLPSLNGSALSLMTGSTPTLAGCLRNARVVARAAAHFGRRILVLPAGERWPDGGLRFAFEDWIGAGAVIQNLSGKKSPEAEAAVNAFERVQESLVDRLSECTSGKELLARGFRRDLELASQLNVSECAPVLRDGAYIRG